MDEVFITNSEEETILRASEFSKKLKPTDVVFLHGDLGSGKTTFTKGIARGLGISSRIISPTFVLMRKHTVDSNSDMPTLKMLYHLDLYRLSGEKEAKAIDLKDFLDDPNGVVVIEWPEIGQSLINKKSWHIQLQTIENEARRIEIDFK